MSQEDINLRINLLVFVFFFSVSLWVIGQEIIDKISDFLDERSLDKVREYTYCETKNAWTDICDGMLKIYCYIQFYYLITKWLPIYKREKNWQVYMETRTFAHELLSLAKTKKWKFE